LSKYSTGLLTVQGVEQDVPARLFMSCFLSHYLQTMDFGSMCAKGARTEWYPCSRSFI